MYRVQTKAFLLRVSIPLFVIFLATPALAVPVTLPSGGKIELTSEQLKALKKEPGIYVIKHPPAGASSHLTLVELPKELGGGFLIGTDKDLSAGLEALGVIEPAEPDQPTFLSGELGATGRISDITGDEAKAQEYRDLDTPVYGDLKLKYEKKDEYFIKAYGKNMGRDDQYYSVIGGSYGKFKIGASYDEIPHRFAKDARSIYDGTETGNLTLRGSRQNVAPPGRVGRMTSLFASGTNVDIDTKRKKIEANADVVALNPFNFRIEFGRENKRGSRPFFGPFDTGLDNTVEIPEPTDYDTTDVKFIGEYTKEPFYINVTYYYSMFKNNTDTLTWDNPFRATDDPILGPARGRIDLAPDNHYHNISASGSYTDLPLNSRITATGAFGWMKQDDNLIPFTTNTALTLPSGASASDPNSLPVDKVDAEVNTALVNVVLTSKPLQFMNIDGKFRYFDYDNKTDRILFSGYVIADTEVAAPDPPASSIRNLPTSYRRTAATLNLGFDVYQRTKITLGYTYDRLKRANREVDKQHDHIFRVALDSTVFSWLDLGVSYDRTERSIDDYIFDIYLKGGEDLEQLPGLRKYDEADLSRDRLHFLAFLYPWEPLTLGATFTYSKDDYDESPYGLLEDEHYTASLEADYAIVDSLTLRAFYTYEYYKNRQKAFGEVPSSPTVDADWFSRGKDIVNTFGARVQAALVPEKLALGISYSYSDVDGTIDFFTPAVATAEFPSVDDSTIQILDTKLKYNVWKSWFLTLGYLWEKFDYDDFNTEGFTNVPKDAGGSYNGAYLMGTLPGDYTVNIGYLKISYRF